MRARMALRYAEIPVEIREISLRDKPQAMLAVSPKGTVPVLVLDSGEVLEQSLDIMQWAIQQRDPEGWLALTVDEATVSKQLIDDNDGAFKRALDRYKYPERYPEQTQQDYRAQGERFLLMLEAHLQSHYHLVRDKLSMADIAIFPFVRQFAAVDADWFTRTAEYPALKTWLDRLVTSTLFEQVMEKYPVWQADKL